MKGPFFTKSADGKYKLIDDCSACSFCDNDIPDCIMCDCPFYFNHPDWEQQEEIHDE